MLKYSGGLISKRPGLRAIPMQAINYSGMTEIILLMLPRDQAFEPMLWNMGVGLLFLILIRTAGRIFMLQMTMLSLIICILTIKMEHSPINFPNMFSIFLFLPWATI